MTSTNTSTNEHYQAIEVEMWRLWRMNKIEESERDPTLHHAKEMAAQIERLQRYGHLWEDDFRETMQRGADDPYVEATIRQMRSECLQPGDLPNDGSDDR